MTLQTKNIVFVFALAAMLVAWPLAQQTAHADTAASMDANCPVNFPGAINFGSFIQGVDDAEVIVGAMTTGGNKAGNLRIDAQDWKGDGQQADGSITFSGVQTGDTVTINTIVYTGVDGASASDVTFQANAGDTTAATQLAASINAGDTATLDATAVLNSVLILADADGVAGNAITLASSNAVRATVSAATLAGGEATGVIHMAAETTKYVFTTTGTPPTTGTAYSAKIPLNSDAAGDKVVIGTVDPLQNVNFIFHISGDGTLTNLPYSGALSQVLTVDVTCVA